MKKTKTINVPYLTLSGEIREPEWFYEHVKNFNGIDADIKDYELSEIIGSKLVLVNGEWHDLGHYAVYSYRGNSR